MTYTLADIANKLNAKLVVPAALDASSEAAVNITSLATLAKATTGQVAFLANSKYIPQLNDTKASAVIVSPNAAKSCPVSALVMDNPYMGYAILRIYWILRLNRPVGFTQVQSSLKMLLLARMLTLALMRLLSRVCT